MNAPVPRIGEMLCQRKCISQDQLRIALIEQQADGKALGRLLIQLGFVKEDDVLQVLAERLGCACISAEQLHPSAEALACIPLPLARQHVLVPLELDLQSRRLKLAMANPADLAAVDSVRAQLPAGYELEVCLAAESALRQCLEGISIRSPISEQMGDADTQQGLDRPPEPVAVVNMINRLLVDAVHRGASDLHLEPDAGFVRLRWRIDGVLQEVHCLHCNWWPPMLNRLKVLAGMNIAETRIPQDGRLVHEVGGRMVDFRVATHPGIHGENMVLRVLDRYRPARGIAELGLGAAQQQQLMQLLALREGLVLVCGPTGAGKTTTLYALLAHINQESIKIATLEDPVEYVLPRIRQTSVGDGNKLDFAAGVRSLLRQDPDVLLVGEIRDADTAAMASRAALAGHQVFSTLHCASALAAVPRLLDMGVSPGILASCLRAVVAQRLLRRLCPHCRIPCAVDTGLSSRLQGSLAGSITDAANTRVIYRAGGCPACNHQGYSGRQVVLEILMLEDDLLAPVERGVGLTALRRAAAKHGFVPLPERALELVFSGASTLEEVERVFGPLDGRRT